jgi:hypothetical protein
LDQGEAGPSEVPVTRAGKATTEALWGVLTYDVMQWVRLSWRPKLSTAMAAYS